VTGTWRGVRGRVARQPVLVRQSGCPPEGPTSGRRQRQGVHGAGGHGDEKRYYWTVAERFWPHFPEYRQLAGGRDIPIMVLEPIAPRTASHPVCPVRQHPYPLPRRYGHDDSRRRAQQSVSFWRRFDTLSIGGTTLRRSGSGHLITSSTARTSSRDVMACSSL